MAVDPNELTPINRSRTRPKLIAGLVIAGLLALICLGVIIYLVFVQFSPGVETVTLAVSKVVDQPSRNQIAFVGNDNNIWLVSPSGEGLRQITTDGGGYRFPTWAPNSQRLAFIGPNEKGEIVLYVSSTVETTPTILFDSSEATPFYLYWSPDSQLITFLTQESSSLALRQANPDDPEASRVLEKGNPFYWVWSPTSEKLLMHVGGSRALSNKAHISILENKVDAERVQLNLAPGGFQAPVWSPDGNSIFYITRENGQETIYRADANTLVETVVTKIDGFAYMVLSPTGQQVAYLQIGAGHRPPFGTPYLIDADGKNKRRLIEGLVGSMYWSPDGTKLALLALARRDDGSTAKAGGLAAPLPQELFFRWWIYDVEAEELEALVSFSPTLDFLQTVPYFDQYHLSLTFWSADSRYFVVTKEGNARKHEGTVWVMDTTGQEEPRQIGEGTLAVWSWQ